MYVREQNEILKTEVSKWKCFLRPMPRRDGVQIGVQRSAETVLDQDLDQQREGTTCCQAWDLDMTKLDRLSRQTPIETSVPRPPPSIVVR